MTAAISALFALTVLLAADAMSHVKNCPPGHSIQQIRWQNCAGTGWVVVKSPGSVVRGCRRRRTSTCRPLAAGVKRGPSARCRVVHVRACDGRRGVVRCRVVPKKICARTSVGRVTARKSRESVPAKSQLTAVGHRRRKLCEGHIQYVRRCDGIDSNRLRSSRCEIVPTTDSLCHGGDGGDHRQAAGLDERPADGLDVGAAALPEAEVSADGTDDGHGGFGPWHSTVDGSQSDRTEEGSAPAAADGLDSPLSEPKSSLPKGKNGEATSRTTGLQLQLDETGVPGERPQEEGVGFHSRRGEVQTSGLSEDLRPFGSGVGSKAASGKSSGNFDSPTAKLQTVPFKDIEPSARLEESDDNDLGLEPPPEESAETVAGASAAFLEEPSDGHEVNQAAPPIDKGLGFLSLHGEAEAMLSRAEKVVDDTASDAQPGDFGPTDIKEVEFSSIDAVAESINAGRDAKQPAAGENAENGSSAGCRREPVCRPVPTTVCREEAGRRRPSPDDDDVLCSEVEMEACGVSPQTVRQEICHAVVDKFCEPQVPVPESENCRSVELYFCNTQHEVEKVEDVRQSCLVVPRVECEPVPEKFGLEAGARSCRQASGRTCRAFDVIEPVPRANTTCKRQRHDVCAKEGEPTKRASDLVTCTDVEREICGTLHTVELLLDECNYDLYPTCRFAVPVVEKCETVVAEKCQPAERCRDETQ